MLLRRDPRQSQSAGAGPFCQRCYQFVISIPPIWLRKRRAGTGAWRNRAPARPCPKVPRPALPGLNAATILVTPRPAPAARTHARPPARRATGVGAFGFINASSRSTAEYGDETEPSGRLNRWSEWRTHRSWLRRLKVSSAIESVVASRVLISRPPLRRELLCGSRRGAGQEPETVTAADPVSRPLLLLLLLLGVSGRLAS